MVYDGFNPSNGQYSDEFTTEEILRDYVKRVVRSYNHLKIYKVVEYV